MGTRFFWWAPWRRGLRAICTGLMHNSWLVYPGVCGALRCRGANRIIYVLGVARGLLFWLGHAREIFPRGGAVLMEGVVLGSSLRVRVVFYRMEVLCVFCVRSRGVYRLSQTRPARSYVE